MERVVAISTEVDATSVGWIEVMAAAADGFDIVLSHQPAHQQVTESALRKLSTRIRQRGAVVVLIDDGDLKVAGSKLAETKRADMECDGVVETLIVSWSGIGSGYGHLQQRTLDVSVSGRRLPGRRQCRLVEVDMMSPDSPQPGVSRMITVWCADWPVVAAGFAPDVPAAVMAANRVVARTAAAAAEGVVVGTTTTAGPGRCPQIRLIDNDPGRERAANSNRSFERWPNCHRASM